MKSRISDEVCENVERCYDDAYDALTVMVKQEQTAYTTRDYMNRRRKYSFGDDPTMNPNVVNNDLIDPAFRGKMCQWSYRLCDHFGTNREIVAFAFSFLDRFVDEYHCDRVGFKLAAMTSMYIATKMMNVKVLRIASLVEMCQGEFQDHQFIQMERIILSALKFRLNPPIAQAYILQLCIFLPTMDDMIASDIFSRAIFYAELSTYDYRFVPQMKFHLAIGCILNSIADCYKEVTCSKMIQTTFLTTICTKIGVDSEVIFSMMNDIQERLSYLYSCSAESATENVQHLDAEKLEISSKFLMSTKRDQINISPVSVVATKRFCYMQR